MSDVNMNQRNDIEGLRAKLEATRGESTGAVWSRSPRPPSSRNSFIESFHRTLQNGSTP
jgi:hypothetical protein